MQLSGIHHLTAISAAIPENHRFYTQTVGMRLVKRSVNQDDVASYPLRGRRGTGRTGDGSQHQRRRAARRGRTACRGSSSPMSMGADRLQRVAQRRGAFVQRPRFVLRQGRHENARHSAAAELRG